MWLYKCATSHHRSIIKTQIGMEDIRNTSIRIRKCYRPIEVHRIAEATNSYARLYSPITKKIHKAGVGFAQNLLLWNF
jgi:hypothetical protein